MQISSLDLPPATQEALSNCNITTVQTLLSLPHLTLSTRTKLPPRDLSALLQQVHSQTAARATPACRLADCAQPVLRTGSTRLDSALRGGWRAAHVAQLAGPPLSGKTQTALAAAAHCLRAAHPVIWLDTSDTSGIIARVTHLLSSFGLDDSAVSTALSNLLLIPTPTLPTALRVLQHIRHDNAVLSHLTPTNLTFPTLHKALSAPRLIVLDSVAALLSPVLGLRTQGWSGHVALNELAASLRALAVRTRATVLVTNRVVRTDASPNGVAFKAALGNCWACFPDTCVMLELAEQRSFYDGDEERDGHDVIVRASVVSKRASREVCTFRIGEHGVHDDE